MQRPFRRVSFLDQLLLAVGPPARARIEIAMALNLGRELARFFVSFLPFRGAAVSLPDLDGGDLVLRAVRGPVGEFGCNHVDGAAGEVESRVDNAGLHALRNLGV